MVRVALLLALVAAATATSCGNVKKSLTAHRPRWSYALRAQEEPQEGVAFRSVAITPTSVRVTVENTGPGPLKVLWDDSVIVDPAGNAHRPVPSTIVPANKDQPQAPTSIPSGARATLSMVPADRMRFEYNPQGQGWWTVDPMFFARLNDRGDYARVCESDSPSVVVLTLAVERAGVRGEARGSWALECEKLPNFYN